jgi:acetyl esterase
MKPPELHPDCRAYLDELARLNLPGGTVDEIRERYRRLCAQYAGPRVEVARVNEIAAPVRMRLYEDDPRAGLLVWFHGGRMISGGLETHDPLCRLLVRETGWRVLSVDYRLAPEHPYPAAAGDARAALGWALAQGGGVALGGDSAGASLALLTALEAPGRVVALALVYPMIDATRQSASHAEFTTGPGTSSEDIRLGYSLWLPSAADPRDPQISPLFSPDFRHLPPTLILTAEVDPLRDEGDSLAARLAAAGVAVHHHRYVGHLHGFLTYPARFAAARDALARLRDLLSATGGNAG